MFVGPSVNSPHQPLIYHMQTELLDTFTQEMIPEDRRAETTEVIGFRNAAFYWYNTNGSASPSRRNFVLRIDNKLVFQRGHINLIVGPTGSGKTSLLMALLGINLSVLFYLSLTATLSR